MPWRRGREVRPPEVTVLTREGCHLCGEMLEVVGEVGDEVGFTPSVRDIDAERDQGLMPESEHERWTTEVPVLLVDGVPVARWRATTPITPLPGRALASGAARSIGPSGPSDRCPVARSMVFTVAAAGISS